MALPSAILLPPDTRANQPSAASVAAGTLYCVSDEGNILEQSDGAAWVAYSPVGSGSGDVTAVGTLTADMVILGDGTTDVKALAAGTAGQVLTMNAGATAAEWAAASSGGGGLVLLDTQTATADATLVFTGIFDSTYDEYQFEILNLLPATDGAFPWMRVSTDGGSTYDSGANYQFDQLVWRAAGTAVRGGVGQTKIILFESGDGLDNTSPYGLCGSLRLFNPLSAVVYKVVTGKLRSFGAGTNTFVNTELGGAYVSATAVDAVQFLFSTGDITSGTIRVYGIEK